MRLRSPSIRMRMIGWYGLSLVLLVGMFALLAQFIEKQNLDRYISKELDIGQQTLEKLLKDPATAPGLLRQMSIQTRWQYFSIEVDQKHFFASDAWIAAGFLALDKPPPNFPETTLYTGGRNNGFYSRDVQAEVAGRRWRIQIALESRFIHDTLVDLSDTFLATGLIVCLLALPVGYFLAGRLLHPLKSMAEKAEHISADRLSERLPAAQPNDEFGRLASVINASFERIQQSYVGLQQFTADAAHQLRSPLTVIRSTGELALQQTLSPPCQEAFGIMLEEADKLHKLVNELLTLARAESGSSIVVQSSVSLKPFLQGVLDFLGPLAEERFQRLTLSVQDDPALYTDPTLLRSALLNIVDNAIKFTPHRGEITLEAAKEDEMISLRISDTGPGIPESERERIFQRFYRRPAGAQDIGSGLGLPIAKQLVTLLGGQITLEARKPNGAIFVIRLPRHPSGSKYLQSRGETHALFSQYPHVLKGDAGRPSWL